MRKIDWAKRDAWCWESGETELGMFYIERQGEEYYAFMEATMLHPANRPLLTLSRAIQVCEDTYHAIMWDQR